MKTKIISVEKAEFEEILTNEPLPVYRRYVNPITGEIIWEHYLGALYGWHEYPFTDLLEAAFQTWLKENDKSKATGK